MEPDGPSAVANQALDLLIAAVGSDTVSFAGSKVWLIGEDFTPAPDLVPADLATVLNGGGISSITMNGTTLNSSIFGPDGSRLLTAPPPVGGWYFEATSPEAANTAYGWAWINAAGDKLIKSKAFDTAVDLTYTGASLILDAITLDLPVGSIV